MTNSNESLIGRQEAFEKWYLSYFGHKPPVALNCKEHEGMTYGNALAERTWLGWQGAMYTMTGEHLDACSSNKEKSPRLPSSEGHSLDAETPAHLSPSSSPEYSRGYDVGYLQATQECVEKHKSSEITGNEYWPDTIRLYKQGGKFYFVAGGQDDEQVKYYHLTPPKREQGEITFDEVKFRARIGEVFADYDPKEPYLEDGSLPSINRLMAIIRPYLKREYGWQPIETAPEDGKKLICWFTSETFQDMTAICYKSKGRLHWYDDDLPVKKHLKIRGWQLFPEPPSTQIEVQTPEEK